MDIGLKENEISLALGAFRTGKGVEIKTKMPAFMINCNFKRLIRPMFWKITITLFALIFKILKLTLKSKFNY